MDTPKHVLEAIALVSSDRPRWDHRAAELLWSRAFGDWPRQRLIDATMRFLLANPHPPTLAAITQADQEVRVERAYLAERQETQIRAVEATVELLESRKTAEREAGRERLERHGLADLAAARRWLAQHRPKQLPPGA